MSLKLSRAHEDVEEGRKECEEENQIRIKFRSFTTKYVSIIGFYFEVSSINLIPKRKQTKIIWVLESIQMIELTLLYDS